MLIIAEFYPGVKSFVEKILNFPGSILIRLTVFLRDAMIITKVIKMEMRTLDHSKVLSLLPERRNDSHKGNFGKLLLLCGSRGFTGAAALSAMGALRAGAGLVYLGVPESIYAIEAIKLNEPVVFPLPDEGGTYSEKACSEILRHLDRVDAVLFGCGSGRSEGVTAVLKTVLEGFKGPVVLDADGINSVLPHIDILRGRTGSTILTPHDGEFQRLGGTVTGDRAACAAQMARELQTIILLKGHRTVITDGTVCYQNTTGNPGMAVGGSGDVLAGMIVSLLGQGIPPLEAAAVAAWLHGSAGDVCASKLGQYAMLPTDMLEVLPGLLK